jgi:HEAT repeat protein
MGLLGRPNIFQLKAKRDVEGLVKALGYRSELYVRVFAAEALGEIGDVRAVESLVAVLEEGAIREFVRTARGVGATGIDFGLKNRNPQTRRDVV